MDTLRSSLLKGQLGGFQAFKASKAIRDLQIMRSNTEVDDPLENTMLTLVDEIKKTNKNGGDSKELLKELIESIDAVNTTQKKSIGQKVAGEISRLTPSTAFSSILFR